MYIGTDRRKLLEIKAACLEGDSVMVDLWEGSLKMAKSYAISFFSPFSFNPIKLIFFGFKKKKSVRSSVSRLVDREKSKRSHNNRPVNFSKMFDLATATLANSRTRVLIKVSHPSLGTCSHYQIHQHWILKKENWLNGVQSYIS